VHCQSSRLVLARLREVAGAANPSGEMAGAQSQAMLEKMELRQSYRNVWHTDLTNAVAADLPCANLFSFPFLHSAPSTILGSWPSGCGFV